MPGRWKDADSTQANTPKMFGQPIGALSQIPGVIRLGADGRKPNEFLEFIDKP